MVATQFASPDDDLFNEASLKESIAEASSDDDEAEKDEVEAFTIVLAEIAWPEWPKVSLLKRTNFNKLIKPPDRTNELIWDHLNGLPYAQDLRKKEKEKVKPTPEEIALRKIERIKRQLEADYPDVEKPQVERDAMGLVKKKEAVDDGIEEFDMVMTAELAEALGEKQQPSAMALIKDLPDAPHSGRRKTERAPWTGAHLAEKKKPE